jgi:pimeloyl-ACP methyl ester carboxylesterase
VWGKNDKILGIKPANQFQELIPHSKLLWIDNCGHVPHLEQPIITTRHILDFLAP